MKTRPILFSGEMVRALLDGRKTQTRRVIRSKAKNMEKLGQECVRRNLDNSSWYNKMIWSVRNAMGIWQDFTHDQMMSLCPYGVPGDLLWVRETWQGPLFDSNSIDDFRINREKYQTPEYVSYRASGDSCEHYDIDLEETVQRWKPSIFMPRWASRLTLRIVNVRVERLNDISEEDAFEEGMTPELYSDMGYSSRDATVEEFNTQFAKRCFKKLWQKINGKESWDSNPWVWVLEFEVIKANVDDVLQEAA